VPLQPETLATRPGLARVDRGRPAHDDSLLSQRVGTGSRLSSPPRLPVAVCIFNHPNSFPR